MEQPVTRRFRETPERGAKVTISAYTGNESGFTIRVEDATSHTIVAEIRMSHAEFGKALASQTADARYQSGDQKYWGSVAENTTTEVTITRGIEDVFRKERRENGGNAKDYARSEEALRVWLNVNDPGARQMFVDGWRPRWSDFGNSHLHVRTERNEEDDAKSPVTYKVVWFRQVDAETGEPIQ